jgi:acyl transferase domain-containing protein
MPIDRIPAERLVREPIAIIGIGCRFPGDANDAASFWKLLSTGADAITEIPEDRWSIGAYYHPVPGVPGKTYSRWGGFIKGVDQFEPECFGISPREASYIDPQQRLVLEVAWEALEDGGQVIERLAGTNTGVFIGISTTDYAQIQSTFYDSRSISAHTPTGGALSIAANRISYCLNLHGPSMAVDTACSSALVATHLACQSLWNHECDLALTGGVNTLIIPENFIGFSAASMLSPDGRCKAFDASANGFVRGEGAGIVLLKPLSKALADGDPVYAVILGSGVNQDGRTPGIAMPSQAAQAALLRETYERAGIAPSQVSYVEAHGTGTAVGDPIEANALGEVLSSGRSEGQYCVMGSVKTNIGHLEAAAGIAGVIKVSLALTRVCGA